MKVRPFKTKWRADAGIINGKRIQKVFDKRKDAELWIKIQGNRQQESRIGMRRLSHGREQIAFMAYEVLDKHGVTDDHVLLDAVKRFCASTAPGKRTPLSDAAKAFERDLNFGNRSPVYVEQIGNVLNRFLGTFSDRQLNDITSTDILEWLQKNCASPANKANRRRELKVFFGWAVRKGLISENPVDRVPRVSVDRGKPEFLTVAQVKSALKHLNDYDRAMFAIMVFAGLRPSEAEALHWEDVKLDRGFLEATRGFRPDNRNVRISENLVAWLRPLAGTDKVFKGHSRRWRDRVQDAIEIEAEPLKPWIQDICRHTFASYHLEKHKDAANLANEMGHRSNVRMLFSHYRDRVDPDAAKAFWEIYPN